MLVPPFIGSDVICPPLPDHFDETQVENASTDFDVTPCITGGVDLT